MVRSPWRKLPAKKLLLVAACIGLAGYIVSNALAPHTFGAQLGNRSLQMGNQQVSDISDYKVSFDLSTAGTLGSVLVQFCSNDPYPGTPCTAPGGFDDGSAVLADQTGPGGFSINPASTSNQLLLSRVPTNAPIGPVSFHFKGVTNPSSPGSYFVRLQTFASADGSGPASDYGGIAFPILNNISITATVPPYLIFCTGITIPGFNCANANGAYIDFGELSPTTARHGTSQMLVATNAVNGYNVTMDGTTLTSGTNVITGLASNDVSRPGTPQFGVNLRANVAPGVGNDPSGPGLGTPKPNYNIANMYRFAPGETIASSSAPDDLRQFTASYIANVPKTQSPGVYVSTVTYICLASF